MKCDYDRNHLSDPKLFAEWASTHKPVILVGVLFILKKNQQKKPKKKPSNFATEELKNRNPDKLAFLMTTLKYSYLFSTWVEYFSNVTIWWFQLRLSFYDFTICPLNWNPFLTRDISNGTTTHLHIDVIMRSGSINKAQIREIEHYYISLIMLLNVYNPPKDYIDTVSTH